jgi:thiamine-phosphate pyrophosphorylase
VYKSQTLVDAVAAALAGGAALVQYRDKSIDRQARLTQVQRLRALCNRFGVPLIVNDDVELARAAGADGVHLGEHDAAPGAARAALGEHALIGVSCYNSLERAEAAAADGADYLAFGSVFPSVSKPGARHAPLALFARAAPRVGRPLCAIGGITAANAGEVIDAGADMVAIINAIFGAADIEAATRELAGLF